ncbi:MAG: hypothetical protein KC492_04685 [Myxococcales bacterium]|nr:hypothetical protein [Myxococcales bacterium]MCB9610155.1 hypothetical protein [Polyangiaceae bacterium]
MTTKTQPSTPELTKRVHLGTSTYGTPKPSVELTAPNGTHHRILKARLHQLAAEVELASIGESWVVVLDAFAERSGCIYLELVHGTAEEAKRAMDVLERVAGERSAQG